MKDVRGVDLQVGQLVAFAERNGNVAEIRTGRITAKFSDSEKISILWDDPRAGKIESTLSVNGEVLRRPRFVVIHHYNSGI